MALSAKQLQRKREKKKARRRDRKPPSMTVFDALVGNLPLHECVVQRSIFLSGIGQVMLARRRPDGNLAVGAFLVDVYCLGVKDAFIRTLPIDKYDEAKSGMHEIEVFQSVPPGYARKLVEGSVAYARALGLPPARDYLAASKIFGNMDPNACTEEFEYGKDGKPCFVNGPHDSEARIRTVLGVLESTCGVGGFNFTRVVPPGRFGDDKEDEFEDEDGVNEDVDDAEFTEVDQEAKGEEMTNK